jgi:hypothetical protein
MRASQIRERESAAVFVAAAAANPAASRRRRKTADVAADGGRNPVLPVNSPGANIIRLVFLCY